MRLATTQIKYKSPTITDNMSQINRIIACVIIVSVNFLTRKIDISKKSSTILIKNLLALIIKWTSGLSSALVDEEIAASVVDVRSWMDD